MPKTLPAQVITQLDAEYKKPVLLFELGLSSTVRYAAYMTNVTFPTGGNVYTAKAITVAGMNQSLEGQINRISLKFDDVLNDMSAYDDEEGLNGKSLIIKRVYLDALGDASYYKEVFNGYMEQPNNYDYAWLSVSASSGKSLKKRVLNFSYQRMCPWIFGGTECNTDSLADLTSLTASGTADSGTVTTLVDNALTQANNYWNYGRIEITKGGVVYRRKVASFDAGSDTVTFDVALPVAVDNTCTYDIFKGCDQTLSTCGASNAWGPSADNTANFGGCVHIRSREESGFIRNLANDVIDNITDITHDFLDHYR
jgi:hypothetical protein